MAGPSSSSGCVCRRGAGATLRDAWQRPLACDEIGAPPAQEQEKKSRIKGIDAVKANIQAAKAVSRVLRTSLGPKGMDKLLQGPDGDVVISERPGLLGSGVRPSCAAARHAMPRSPPP